METLRQKRDQPTVLPLTIPLPKNSIATKACLLLALLCAGTAAKAESIGTVTALSGTLLAKRANGTISVLAIDSPLEPGVTLASRKDTYARLDLADHSSVTLGADTELIIERYSFDETQPQNNAAVLSLPRGRVRIATGLLGRRHADSFTLTTPSATIDIRDAILIANYVAPAGNEVAWRKLEWQARSAYALVAMGYTTTVAYEHVSIRTFTDEAPLPSAANSRAILHLAQNANMPPSAGLAPGLYVQVLDGLIHLSNGGGTQNFTAGQFGFTPSFVQPPVVLPTNPGMQFTPPASFSSTTAPQGGSSGGKPGNVDCQVR
jgi:FecR protein